MAKAIPARGEISITLEGVEYLLRPSYEAIEQFQASTRKGLLQLTREALSGDLTTAEAAQIVTECMRAEGRAKSDETIARFKADVIAALMMEAEGGFAAVLGVIAGMLSGAVTGGYTATGEIKAPAGKKATPAGA
jgi:hypothetical protein